LFSGQNATVAFAENGGKHESSHDMPGSKTSGQSDVSYTHISVYGIGQGTTFSHPDSASSASHWSSISSQVADTAPT
jgi:hypothetical protein